MYDDYENWNEPDDDEIEEAQGESATETKIDFGHLKIDFDVENMARGIASAVKSDLKDEIIASLKKDFLSELRNDIMDSIREVSFEIVKDVYDNEKVIEGGWGEEKKEYTVRQYILMKIQNTFKDGSFTFESKDRWGDKKTETVRLEDYINSQLSWDKFKKEIDGEISDIKSGINNRIKNMFNSSVKSALADSIVQVLMENETYRKIQTNIACIADKKD